jgi:hypothetical protein
MHVLLNISIFAQVNITNPTRWLVKFDVLICYIHVEMNITKSKFSKWRPAVLFKLVIEISKIKMNSYQINTKKLVQKY